MPVVPVYLDIDEETYKAVQAGTLVLCGMAKNVDTKRVAKHIPVVKDSVKDGTIKVVDFVRKHKKGTFFASGVLIIGGATFGLTNYVTHRKQRKLEKQFGEALQKYLDAAKGGILTIDEVDTLLEAIEALGNNGSGDINLNISSNQFSELIKGIFDYTMRLADASEFNKKKINRPKYFKNKTVDDLRYYLDIQRQILENAA